MEEHRAMTECKHNEADQLYFCCLFCGRLNLPDPAWLVIVAGLAMIGANMAWWVML